MAKKNLSTLAQKYAALKPGRHGRKFEESLETEEQRKIYEELIRLYANTPKALRPTAEDFIELMRQEIGFAPSPHTITRIMKGVGKCG